MNTNNTNYSDPQPKSLIDRDAPSGSAGSLQRRRWLVSGILFSLAACMAGQAAGYRVVTAVGLALFICGAVMVRRMIDDLADKPAAYLDERQLEVRNRSYLLAYRLTGATVALAIVLVAALGAAEIPKQVVLTVLSGMLFVSIVAPSCVVAWTEKEG